jgi:NADPH:quinone reductase
MRAVVVELDSSNRLGFREVEEPTPAPSEALVRVAAISLNRGEVRRAELVAVPAVSLAELPEEVSFA